MKSPVSTCGVYVGLCLPRRREAIWLASLPSTLFWASTTYQPCWTSPAFAEYVFMIPKSVPGLRKGSNEGARLYPKKGAGGHDYNRHCGEADCCVATPHFSSGRR